MTLLVINEVKMIKGRTKLGSDGIHQEIEYFLLSLDKNLVPEYFKPYRILHFSRAIDVSSCSFC